MQVGVAVKSFGTSGGVRSQRKNSSSLQYKKNIRALSFAIDAEMCMLEIGKQIQSIDDSDGSKNGIQNIGYINDLPAACACNTNSNKKGCASMSDGIPFCTRGF